jgi:hypothetical protein
VDRTLGCIIYPACELDAPGVIRVIEGNRFPLGEIDGADTERVRMLAQLFRNAGFKTPVLSDIRAEIWLKLWGNLSFNPISALTHATLEDICRFPETRALAATMMAEAQVIGEKLGVPFKVSLDKRIAGAEAVGPHKTSMLQDVESGRVLELDALVKSVIAAIVLPNGPEMARLRQHRRPGATTAPLNPGVHGRRVRVLPGRSRGQAAGGPMRGSESPAVAVPDDVALVLHTSGTTSRPKIVPLTPAQRLRLRRAHRRERWR